MAARSEPALGRIVSANDLLAGRVVYLTAAGGWSPDIAEARIAVDARDATALLAAGERDFARVVGPYLVELRAGGADARPEPAALRERIRLRGPSAGRGGDAAGERERPRPPRA